MEAYSANTTEIKRKLSENLRRKRHKTVKFEKRFCKNSQEIPSEFDGYPKNKKESEDFVDENPDFVIILL